MTQAVTETNESPTESPPTPSAVPIQKKRVLFVGGFSLPPDGTEGGQVFACRSLLRSPLSQLVDWVKVDSTQRSEPPPSLPVRMYDAVCRVLKCIGLLITKRPKTMLVFSGTQPLSLLEKGFMCWLGRFAGAQVVLSLRSFPMLTRRGQSVYRAVIGFFLRRCSTIVCQTRLAAAELNSLFGTEQDKIEVLYNWIDTDKFSPQKSTIESVDSLASAKASRLDESSRNEVLEMAYVGWLHPNKGLTYLVEAMQLLRDRGVQIHLSLYGGGLIDRELREMVAELHLEDSVRFHGWIENKDVPAALHRADFFVFPTLREGMPNALLQAMACGLPVLTTNVSGIPEYVKHGVNGLIVDARDEGQLADAIQEMASSPQARVSMGKANREQIEARHDIETTWPRMASLLEVSASSLVD